MVDVTRDLLYMANQCGRWACSPYPPHLKWKAPSVLVEVQD